MVMLTKLRNGMWEAQVNGQAPIPAQFVNRDAALAAVRAPWGADVLGFVYEVAGHPLGLDEIENPVRVIVRRCA